MLKQRILTATVLIGLILAILFLLPPIAFTLFTVLLLGFAGWEWSHIMGFTHKGQRIFYVMLMILVMIGVGLVPAQQVLLLSLFGWIIALYCVISYGRNGRYKAESKFFKGLAGIFVLAPCWLGLNVLRIRDHGAILVLLVFLIVWMADTAAYFVGRRFGQHKLLERVSPGKTIEGAIAAMLGSLILSLTFLVLLLPQSNMYEAALFIILVMITAFFSIVGDLFKSVLKRQQNLKDSGNILPGHGGILDRIDSLTAAAPIFALGILFLGIG